MRKTETNRNGRALVMPIWYKRTNKRRTTIRTGSRAHAVSFVPARFCGAWNDINSNRENRRVESCASREPLWHCWGCGKCSKAKGRQGHWTEIGFILYSREYTPGAMEEKSEKIFFDSVSFLVRLLDYGYIELFYFIFPTTLFSYRR